MATDAPDAPDMDAPTHEEPAGTAATDTTEADSSPEVEKWKAMARKHEKAARDASKELNTLREASQSETEKAISRARDEARSEVLAQANARMVSAAVLTAAAGKLADPTDAVALIDLAQFEVDDSGEVDTSAVDKAVAALLKAKPHLAANRTPAPLPGAKGNSNGSSGESVNDWLRRSAGITN